MRDSLALELFEMMNVFGNGIITNVTFLFCNTITKFNIIIGFIKTNKGFSSFFSEIGLKRKINSTMTILIALNMDYDSFCLYRFGTNCLELFFGLIRGFSKCVDGWDKFGTIGEKTKGKWLCISRSSDILFLNP